MTPSQLFDAALEGRAVVGLLPYNHKPIPAAFVASMQFRYVMMRIDKVRLYKPQKKSKSMIPKEIK